MEISSALCREIWTENLAWTRWYLNQITYRTQYKCQADNLNGPPIIRKLKSMNTNLNCKCWAFLTHYNFTKYMILGAWPSPRVLSMGLHDCQRATLRAVHLKHDYIVVCQVHPALVKWSRVTRLGSQDLLACQISSRSVAKQKSDL